MKRNPLLSTDAAAFARSLVFCRALLAWTLLSPTLFAADPESLADQIQKRPVFPNPILWVGDTPPPEAESLTLLNAFEVMRGGDVKGGIQLLEEFVAAHPDSAWTPSLEANLGDYYYRHGRYSLALQLWPKAWDAAKDKSGGAAKRTADLALVKWSRLLASLGRKERLETLFTETEDRTLDRGPLQQSFNQTKEGYRNMVVNPGRSYKCGIFALYHVRRALNMGNYDYRKLLTNPSPPTGFSMEQLVDFASELGYEMIPLEREQGDQIVVPSVVHWKENHYAAIVDLKEGLYRVIDPTFGDAKWRSAETINAEASGYFLVPAEHAPDSWRRLTPGQARQIFGKGSPNNIEDKKDTACGAGEDPACERCSAGANSAPAECGMPVWRVSEPYITLWITDVPIAHTTSFGRSVFFQLNYKQRENQAINDTFSVGTQWSFNWKSFAQPDTGSDVDLHVMGGGVRKYALANPQPDPDTDSVLSAFPDGQGNTDYRVDYASGSANIYGFNFTYDDGTVRVFLSDQLDPQGRATHLDYQVIDGDVRLTQIVDPDGRTLTFSYNEPNPVLISEIQGPLGSATLNYNGSGQLTQITDVIGLASSFTYDGQGRVNTMTTPYGVTSFAFSEATNHPDFELSGEMVNRSVRITDPTGGNSLYAYRDSSLFLSFNETDVPNTAPRSNTFSNSYLTSRNTFYWGSLQYDRLSPAYKSNPSNFDLLTVADYRMARRRHWLHDRVDIYLVGKTLALQQEPSAADGATEGPKTWFDHWGKEPVYEGGPPQWFMEGADPKPRLIARILPNGQTAYSYFERNDKGNPTLIESTYTKAGGGVSTRGYTFEYAPNGIDLLQVRDPNSTVIGSITWNSFHQVLTSTDALNQTTTFNYDPTSHQLAGITRPTGLTTIFTYDTNNRLQTIQDQEINRTESFSYWPNWQVLGHTDDRSLQRYFEWDALGRPIYIVFLDLTSIDFQYNRLDLSGVKDRLGNWTYFTYDAMRRLTAVTDPRNNTTTYTYCPCGSLESVKNPLNQTTSFQYDSAGRRTSIAYPTGGGTQSFAYDVWGRLTGVLNNAGAAVESYSYNNQGLIEAVTNPFGEVTRWVYDLLDRPQTLIQAGGPAVTQTFDDLNRTLTRTTSGAGTESFQWSARGLTSYTDALNRVTQYTYDEAGRLLTEVNNDNGTTSHSYNPAGDLLTLTDPKNQTTTWTYDNQGRVATKSDAIGTILTLSYDLNGRPTNRWSYAKGTTSFSYDLAGNLTSVNYPNSPDVTFQYDALNRVGWMTDALGASSFTYTEFGAPWAEYGPWSSDDVFYSYNQDRLLSQVSLSQPGTGPWNQSYGYDSALRLETTISPAGAFDYDYIGATHRIETLGLPNGSSISRDYDPVGRLWTTTLRDGAQTVLNHHGYIYNAAHERTKQYRLGNYVNYTYDPLGQLKTAFGYESVGTPRQHEKLTYDYDPAGNLTQRINNALTQNFTVPTRNQINSASHSGAMTVAGGTRNATSVTVNGTTASLYSDGSFAAVGINPSAISSLNAEAHDASGGSVQQSFSVNLPASSAFIHDGNGNLTSDGNRIYTYDDADRLIRTEVPGSWRTEYVYDGLGRRRIRKEYNGSGVLIAEVRYLYAGSLVIQERDGGNSPQVIYTRGPDFSGSLSGAGGIGGLLARTDANGHAYYHADGSGNITALIDEEEELAAQYLYDPFGNLLAMSGPLAEANVYRFSSKEFDVNSGLYYYGFRYYEPNLQRWINRDPLGESGGINLYGFVGNNPINHADPYGLEWLIFDGEAWGQLAEETGIPGWLRKTFIGNPCPKEDLRQFSNLALRAREGVGVSTFEGANCEKITGSQLMLRVALAPLDGVLTAATLPMGGGGSQIFRQGTRAGVRVGSSAAVSAKWRQVLNLRRMGAANANAPFVARGQFAPFAEGTFVRQFDAATDLNFVRVHGSSNPRGGWLVRANEIRGLTAQKIKRRLALPETPTHIQAVTVPKGTTLQVGRIGAQPQWGAPLSGGFQYRVDGILPEASFGKSIRLGQ